jgi:hypothetical protein
MGSIDGKEIVGAELKVINIGAQTFYDSLKEQGVTVLQVDWHPPAGGDPEMIALLDKLL